MTGVYTRRDAGFIPPGSPLWRELVTPSKVAAILGVSRYESPYRLWHRMKGLVPPEPPKDEFDTGHDFEPAAANRWRRANPGWALSPGEVQFVLPDTRFGFPALATLDRRASRGSARRVVEFKTARGLSDLEAWGDDLTGDCPQDYAAQVMALMLFTGWTRHPGHLLALGPYFNERLYVIEHDPAVTDWIVACCRDFHASLASDEPPPLDDRVATYQCVRAQHPDIDAGVTAQIEPKVADDFVIQGSLKSVQEAKFRFAKTVLLNAMGNAQYAESNGVRFARRQATGVGGKSVALYPINQQQPLKEKV